MNLLGLKQPGDAPSASRLRPKRLHGLTLTNMPGNRGGRPISTIENRYPGTSKAIETAFSPIEAGAEFTKLVNRKQRAEGLDFTRAWNLCRIEQPALFNRMGARNQPSGKVSQAAPPIDFARIAGEALNALATQEKGSGPFYEAWGRVCNRRTDLVGLSNRELPEASWGVLEIQAREKFIGGVNLDPDGRVIRIVQDHQQNVTPNKHSTRRNFESVWDKVLNQEPKLKPSQIWNRIKETYPIVFWPFVAMTAK